MTVCVKSTFVAKLSNSLNMTEAETSEKVAVKESSFLS